MVCSFVIWLANGIRDLMRHGGRTAEPDDSNERP